MRTGSGGRLRSTGRDDERAARGSRGSPRSRRAAHGPPPAPVSAAPGEAPRPGGVEPRGAHAGRHLELLAGLARARIDAAEVAVVAFPGTVPELAVDPRHAGDETVGRDRAQDLPGLGIDLVDLPLAILSHPQRALGPGESRIATAAGGRDRGQHAT